ncbi:cation:proton antiporter [Streptomyces bobili]|uniref:cation:proton antiporter domain-containing protein n=1 Tax=Streptomyces bobili TaxID=67280 RepID=UPI003413C5F0
MSTPTPAPTERLTTPGGSACPQPSTPDATRTASRRPSALRTYLTTRQFLVLAVPVIAYVLCAVVEGSGFLGAWVADLAFGIYLRRTPADLGILPQDSDPAQSTRFTERLGLLLASLSFLVFGAVILGPTLQHLSWRMVLYALLSLTIVRMLPVALALAGTGLRPASIAYIGWFGPRGLASLVFGLLALEEHLPGGTLLSDVIAVTVGLSIVLHGTSAPFLGDRYGTWFTRTLRKEPNMRENALAQHDGPR